MEKVTKYRDIMPHSDTLSKLRSGKVRRESKPGYKRLGGEARVLTYKHVNLGLKRLEDEECNGGPYLVLPSNYNKDG